MGRQGAKKTGQSGSDNSSNFLQVPASNFLQVPGIQVTDDGDIPLVLVNERAAPQAERKRSRAISKVSMSSDDGTAVESEKVS